LCTLGLYSWGSEWRLELVRKMFRVMRNIERNSLASAVFSSSETVGKDSSSYPSSDRHFSKYNKLLGNEEYAFLLT